MTNPRIICLGEILFDYLADQIGKSYSEVTSWTHYPGGAPANVACALVKLGTPAAFIGCLGQDQPGNELLELCQEIGVDTTGVQRHPSAPTRLVYVVRSENGDREFAGFGNRTPDEFADAFLHAQKLPVSLFEPANFLIHGTLELAYPQTREAIFLALDLAEQYDLKVMVDVNWRPKFWLNQEDAKPLIEKLWSKVDFVKLASEEAEWLFDTTDAGAIAHRLNSVEGVIVTDGGAEVSYCLSDNEGKIKPFSMSVQDTTGAGDSFVAGFLHQIDQRGISSLQDKETAHEIVTYACAVGGLTTTKPGAIASQPTADAVATFLEQIK